jgi:hypothetical protein
MPPKPVALPAQIGDASRMPLKNFLTPLIIVDNYLL